MPEASLREPRPRGASRWSWLPIPALLVAVLALQATRPTETFESWGTLFWLSLLFTTVSSCVVAILAGKSFVERGAPGLLFLGTGALVWGLAGPMGPLVLPADDWDGFIASHNLLVWLAAACHLTGVLASARARPALRARTVALTLGYAGGLAAALVATLIVAQGLAPRFFVQGEGGTVPRTLVLSSAAAMLVTSAALLLRRGAAGGGFARWYAHGLLLIATGVAGLCIQTVHGGWVGWTARAAQFLGSVYMLVAAVASVRESGAWRVSLEEAVSRGKELLAAQARLLDLSGDAIFVRDARDRITYWNRGASEAYGWSEAEALGRVSHELLATEFPVPREEIEDSLQRTGRWEGELVHVARDGRRVVDHSRWVVDRADPAGGARVLQSNTDVTAWREAERERERLLASERAARAEADRANELKDEFLATLSHELRTPLNAILGWSYLLQRGGAEAETRAKGLEVIERNARAQGRLIADLLDTSRVVSGKMRLDVHRVELPFVVQAACESLRPAAEARGVRVETAIEPLLEALQGDSARLQQVVWNLVSNAIKFTPRGGRVRVELARSGREVHLCVSDTGQGIAPEFLPHLFERFRQADSRPAREHGGLGLGLSIVKDLVELHGGSVRAASAGRGQGATFTVVLPLPPAREAPARDGVDAAPARPAAPARRAAAVALDLSGVKVLVVDDEADAREVVERVLLACRANVLTAASGPEALDLLSRERPDVLLSDIGMPGEDGYGFIGRVRAAGHAIPSVALTAFAREEDRARARLAGYQGHVSKPVEASELIATVAAVARRPLREPHIET